MLEALLQISDYLRDNIVYTGAGVILLYSKGARELMNFRTLHKFSDIVLLFYKCGYDQRIYNKCRIKLDRNV